MKRKPRRPGLLSDHRYPFPPHSRVRVCDGETHIVLSVGRTEPEPEGEKLEEYQCDTVECRGWFQVKRKARSDGAQ